MSSSPPGTGWRSRGLPLALSIALVAAWIGPPGAGDFGPNAGFEDYRKHLQALDALVAACRKQRTPAACDPSQVGSDDRLQWSSGAVTEQREIGYDWLRNLLDRAGKKEAPVQQAPGPVQVVKTHPASVDDLLAQARERIVQDLKQAGTAVTAGPVHAAERKSLNTILARREYQGVSQATTRERFLDWLENWLNGFLERLARFGSRSPWIAFALRALLLVSICLGFVWALVRIERRARIRLVPDSPSVPGSPSAREWQLWLQDANNMAAHGLWRDAIHFLYWAAISRLESRHLWPADRARTPREYLRLLSGADPRKANLATLTRSFERTWYGGREADASDFKAALKLAAELGVE